MTKNSNANDNQLGGLSRQAPARYIPAVTGYVAGATLLQAFGFDALPYVHMYMDVLIFHGPCLCLYHIL